MFIKKLTSIIEMNKKIIDNILLYFYYEKDVRNYGYEGKT